MDCLLFLILLQQLLQIIQFLRSFIIRAVSPSLISCRRVKVLIGLNSLCWVQKQRKRDALCRIMKFKTPVGSLEVHF